MSRCITRGCRNEAAPVFCARCRAELFQPAYEPEAVTQRGKRVSAFSRKPAITRDLWPRGTWSDTANCDDTVH